MNMTLSRANRARLLSTVAAGVMTATLVSVPAFAEDAAPDPTQSSEPAPQQTQAPAPEPSQSVEPAPSIPAPPGAQTSWSNGDGSAPSQEWFDAWAQMQELAQQGSSRPATDRNILMPWESASGQTEFGQGQAVTGGWSYVNPDGTAGAASIVCGTYCASGWIPTTFGANGIPTGWQRVIQQTVPSETGNVAGANSVYRPETGWVVESATGTFAWDWQTNTVGACIANCVTPSPEPSVSASPDPTATVAPDASLTAAASALDTPAVLVRAARATTVTKSATGAFSVRVVNTGLRKGETVTIIATRKGKVVKTWRVKITKTGSASLTLPSAWLGARISIRHDGRLVGVSTIKA